MLTESVIAKLTVRSRSRYASRMSRIDEADGACVRLKLRQRLVSGYTVASKRGTALFGLDSDRSHYFTVTIPLSPQTLNVQIHCRSCKCECQEAADTFLPSAFCFLSTVDIYHQPLSWCLRECSVQTTADDTYSKATHGSPSARFRLLFLGDFGGLSR